MSKSLSTEFSFLPKTGRAASFASAEGAFPFFTSSQDTVKRAGEADCHGPALVFGTGGSASVHVVDGPFSASNDCYICKPNSGAMDDAKFAHYFLRSNIHLIEVGFKGAGLKHVSKKHLLELEIPSGDRIHRHRVVSILDKADAIRRKREQALTLADDFLRSVFLEMFGDLNENPHKWQSQPLVMVLATDPQNGLYRHSSDYGTGTQILRIDGFYDGYLLGSETFKRLRIDQATRDKYLLRENDIVINRVNSPEYLGKCALISGLVEDTVFESNMMRFSVDPKKVNPRFLVDQFRSQYMKRQIATSAKPAVNQSSINQTDVKSFMVRLPPIALQNRYAEIVGAKDRADQRLRGAVGAAKDLFAALSQRAFAGDL